jgi:hypothetical protein
MPNVMDWFENIVCPYCGSEKADWVDTNDACLECPDCDEIDCI